MTKKSERSLSSIQANETYTKISYHIKEIYDSNISSLHGCEISIEEFEAMLRSDDKDEKNFLITYNELPAAWLKLNGLLDSYTGWISMLAVLPTMQRRGIGKWTIKFAEKSLKEMGKKQILLKTTNDNSIAINFYLSNGYRIKDYKSYITSDGIKRDGIVFIKQLD